MAFLTELLQDPEFWITAAFIGFIALAIYYRFHTHIGEALDKRAQSIKAQLEEARRLREEAETLLATYQRKRREAEREAEDIVAHAREESERQAAAAKKAMEEMIERRSRMAEEKIAQAEAEALKQVKVVAAEVATRVARRVIVDSLDEAKARDLIDQAIADLDKNLH